MAEHHARDEERLGQEHQRQLLTQAPEHLEGDDVARILGPVQQAAGAFFESLRVAFPAACGGHEEETTEYPAPWGGDRLLGILWASLKSLIVEVATNGPVLSFWVTKSKLPQLVAPTKPPTASTAWRADELVHFT